MGGGVWASQQQQQRRRLMTAAHCLLHGQQACLPGSFRFPSHSPAAESQAGARDKADHGGPLPHRRVLAAHDGRLRHAAAAAALGAIGGLDPAAAAAAAGVAGATGAAASAAGRQQ